MRFTVEYLFNLRDRASAQLRKISAASKAARSSVHAAGGAFNKMEHDANRASNSLGRLAHRMRALRTVSHSMRGMGLFGSFGMMAGSGMMMRDIGGTLLSFYDAINSANAKFSKGKGLSPERLALMKEAVQELGRTTRFTTTEVGNAMNMLAMAGQTLDQAVGSDTKGFTKGSLAATLNLAAATGADLARSADIVTNIMSAYGIGVNELSRVSDVLTYAVNSSNQNIYELANAMKMAGPSSKEFGISLEQTAAMTMALANAGIKATMAGTGIRRMATRMVAINSQSAKVFKRLGIDPKSYSKGGKIDDVFGVLQKFIEVGAKTNDIFEIFGDRAGPIMLRLMSVGPERLRELAKELKGASGAAEASRKIMEMGLPGAFRKLLSRLEAVKIGLGEAGLTKDLRSIADGITYLSDKFKELDPVTKQWIARLLLAITAFSMAVIPLGIFAIALSALVPIVGAVLSPLKLLTILLLRIAYLSLVQVAGGLLGLAIGIGQAAKHVAALWRLHGALAALALLGKVALAITVVVAGIAAAQWIYDNWERLKQLAREPLRFNAIFPEAPDWVKYVGKQLGWAHNEMTKPMYSAASKGMQKHNHPGARPLSVEGIQALRVKSDVNVHLTHRIMTPKSIQLYGMMGQQVGSIPISAEHPKGRATAAPAAAAAP